MYAPRGHRRGRQLLQSEWYLFGSAIFVATVRTTVGAPAADCVRPTAAVGSQAGRQHADRHNDAPGVSHQRQLGVRRLDFLIKTDASKLSNAFVDKRAHGGR